MKYIYFTLLVLLSLLVACEPASNYDSIGGEISAEELIISAEPLIVDGVKSNKIIVKNESPVLSEWDFRSGYSYKSVDTVLYVTAGEGSIIFTGLNPNGTKITKTLSIVVDDLVFPVPVEWDYLFGDGEKEWEWDTTWNVDGVVWGGGTYKSDVGPAWWLQTAEQMNGMVPGEGQNATMKFASKDLLLTKYKNDGTKEEGSFYIDMNSITTKDNGDVWAKGKLKTKKTTIIAGKEPWGWSYVYEFDIVELTETHMILSCVPKGEEVYFWVFKAKK